MVVLVSSLVGSRRSHYKLQDEEERQITIRIFAQTDEAEVAESGVFPI